MKKQGRKGTPRGTEYVVIVALLAVYAVTIFFTPDPRWVVWAGQMSVGVIDPAALPPPSTMDVTEALRTASTRGVCGLAAVVVLLAAALGMRHGHASPPADHAVAGGHADGRGAGPHT